MRNLQDLEIIDSVSCKLREGLNGSEAANAPVRRFVSLSLGGAPQPQARAGAVGRSDGLAQRNRTNYRTNEDFVRHEQPEDRPSMRVSSQAGVARSAGY